VLKWRIQTVTTLLQRVNLVAMYDIFFCTGGLLEVVQVKLVPTTVNQNNGGRNLSIIQHKAGWLA
jgi:hypothetical protein